MPGELKRISSLSLRIKSAVTAEGGGCFAPFGKGYTTERGPGGAGAGALARGAGPAGAGGALKGFGPAVGGALLNGQGNEGVPAAFGFGAAAGPVALGSSGCWGRSPAGKRGSPTRTLHVILCLVRQAVQTSTRKTLCSKHWGQTQWVARATSVASCRVPAQGDVAKQVVKCQAFGKSHRGHLQHLEFTAAGSGGDPEEPGTGAWVFPFGTPCVGVLPNRSEDEGVGVPVVPDVGEELGREEEGVPVEVGPVEAPGGGAPACGMG